MFLIFTRRALSGTPRDAVGRDESEVLADEAKRIIILRMHENEVATRVIEAAFRVHNELGPGLLETVYEAALQLELVEAGMDVKRQQAVPVVYKSLRIAQGFRADLIVERKLIVEIKAVDVVPQVAYKILLTYLKFADIRLGLLINFSEPLLKNGIKRVANKL